MVEAGERPVDVLLASTGDFYVVMIHEIPQIEEYGILGQKPLGNDKELPLPLKGSAS